MPTYSYQCKSCQHKLEAKQKITDKPKKVCPVCNKKQLFKVIESSRFILKGEWT